MHLNSNIQSFSARLGTSVYASLFMEQKRELRTTLPSALNDQNAGEIVHVINDMQPVFSASNKESVLLANIAEIQLAMRLSHPIIFVEYDPIWSGKTHECLVALVEDYSRKVFVTKSTDREFHRRVRGEKNLPHAADDGSEQIIEGCIEGGFSPSEFRFTGVNADVCILKTVGSLRLLLPQTPITIVTSACNSEKGNLALKKFKRLGCLIS
jgi:hypothetical protein